VGRSGCFSSKIVCGECGSYYGRKVWHSNDKYRTVIWRCQHKYDNGEPCKTPHVTEDQIKAGFVEEFNRLAADKTTVLEDIRILIDTLTDTKTLDRDEATAISEIEIVAGLIRKLVDENAHAAIDPDEYDRRYNELLARYYNAKARVAEIEERRSARKARTRDLEAFYMVLKMTGPLAEFDEGIWNVAVESALVYTNGLITFAFPNGCEI